MRNLEIDEYPRRADFDPGGWGYQNSQEALDSIDAENPPLGSTFRIDGNLYVLVKKNGKLEFEEYEE